MARASDTGELEASDDSISITSTVESEKKEDYEVECILAEKRSKGAIKYLTAWKGYSEIEHEWLPRENFNEGDAFSQWTVTKTRINKGLQKPFDVKAWKQRCNAILSEIRSRKERRRVKRLRLIERDKLIPVGGEQNNNTQSSGLNPAQKQSNKRIKRRSVHQDSTPSSPTSVPPSSSSSEDSDRPLMSRQQSEIFTSNRKWTQAQTIALEEGLRTLKGPRWRELLSLYGRNGTINQLLKDKTPTDLYDKAKSVRQEFVDSGREPPEYLRPFSTPASSKGSRTATPNVYSESRGQSRAMSNTGSRSTSVDSLMAELHHKHLIRKDKSQKIGRAQQNAIPVELISSAREQKKASDSVKETLGCEPKAAQASQPPARQSQLPAAEKAHNENPTAAQNISYPRKAASPAKGTTGDQRSINNPSLQDRQPEAEPRTKEPPLMSDFPQIDRPSKLQVPSPKESANSATNATTQPELLSTNVLENAQTTREEVAQTKWSGTARAQTARPSITSSTRSEAAGSGPTRPSSSKVKPKLGQIEPKKPSVIGDVTAAWNAEPRKRASNNWATKNADPVDGQPSVRKYKLSVQNKIFKSRREGRVPDPSCLLFIDPKTGKAPMTVPTASATAVPSKTPLQLHQEELAAREAEEHLALEEIAAEKREEFLAQEVEKNLATSKNEPDPIRLSDQEGELRAKEQEVSDMGTLIAKASESPLRLMTGGVTDGSLHTDNAHPPPPPPPPSSDHGPPLNAPLGPRIGTKKSNTMSLHDYTKRSTPVTQSSHETVVNSHRPYSSDETSMFALRGFPIAGT